MGSRNKGESYFTLDKFECYWEDAFMQIDWKNLDEAKLDTPQIACRRIFNQENKRLSYVCYDYF